MEGERLFTNLNPMVAYEKGVTTWAKWVDLNLDPRRTQVIFRNVSHFDQDEIYKLIPAVTRRRQTVDLC
ncbi:protein trichome birefringence-like 36 [Canna indica]|uniref:Protein trichome birefringence-like 36 n=1 Tax=Canna indica TaxID=4628 RepID=A0AAQ3K427_9LILI|nr:protein trichome birefringence-like 36 [Canna indica]